jgi:hypothetical protein
MEMNKQMQLEGEAAKQEGKQAEIAAKGKQESALSAQEAEQQMAETALGKAMEAPEKSGYNVE